MEFLPQGRSTELTNKLLRGAIDIHCHPGPHLFSSPRYSDPFALAIEARDRGMRANVLIDCFEMTNGYAWIINRHVPGFTVFGGMLMNTVYGGMNPRSVLTALNYGDGARYVNFGTHSTYFQANREGRVVNGEFKKLSELYPKFRDEELSRAIRIPVDEDPDPKLDEILKMIADHPYVYIDCGHVSVPEAKRLLELKEKYGYEKVVISSAVTKIAETEDLIEMAKMGGIIEFTYAAYSAPTPIPLTHYYVEKEYTSIDEGMDKPDEGGIIKVAKQIKEIGAEHCVMGTDYGRYALSSPVDGLREFIACMLDLGITEEEIGYMVRKNPEYLLGLDPWEETEAC